MLGGSFECVCVRVCVIVKCSGLTLNVSDTVRGFCFVFVSCMFRCERPFVEFFGC